MLIAFLTALASVLYALDRLGVDIGWFNPWSWSRRRKWRKQYHAKPAFSLTSPMEAIALLLAATAKADGDISIEEKQELLRLYETTFKLSEKDAAALFRMSVFLLGDTEAVFQSPDQVLAPSLEKFSVEQKKSAIELLHKVANISDQKNEAKIEFVSRVVKVLSDKEETNGWQ